MLKNREKFILLFGLILFNFAIIQTQNDDLAAKKLKNKHKPHKQHKEISKRDEIDVRVVDENNHTETVALRCIPGEDAEEIALASYRPKKIFAFPKNVLKKYKISKGDIILIHTDQYEKNVKQIDPKFKFDKEKQTIVEVYSPIETKITGKEIQEQSGHFDLPYHNLILIHPRGYKGEGYKEK